MSSEENYDTLEKIGHGSFGIIRKVRRKADGFILCRKEISYLRMSQKEREQLHAEFQILSHLRHPNIVAYYRREHLKISQDLHLYMEYCGNGDLGRMIKDLQHKGQRAQESFVWSIFSQLVMALYRCHYGVDPPDVGANVLGLMPGTAASGSPKVPAGTMTILHRDLKPENVFLGEDNSVKLGDFGLSKMIKSHDFASTYVGTPFYMSPEICAAEKYTLKSDIWSLGCIIYELCAREPPFNAKTHFQLVQKIKEGKVAALPELYSPELGQVIKDCLRTNPDHRPDTAQLLNLPVVRLMRKEKEVVDLNRALKRKEKQLDERLAELECDKTAARAEVDASLRREWEVKARLEIDRLAKAEMEQLQRRFEDEVRTRVEDEVRRQQQQQQQAAAAAELSECGGFTSSAAKLECPPSSTSGDDLLSSTDMTECSLESPDGSREGRRSARTPFSRTQTMFAGTPMDVEMVSSSPMAIASLALSPQRPGAAKAPTVHSGNIFAVRTEEASRGAGLDGDEGDGDGDDDDEVDEEAVPSPTRHIRSSKNPFTGKGRPVLATHKTCPTQPHLAAKSAGFVSKAADARPRSPGRQVHKMPAAVGSSSISISNSRRSITSITSSGTNGSTNGSTSSHGDDGGSMRRRPSAPMARKHAAGGEALSKTVAKNNLRGRTLVELQQARVGGRAAEKASPGKRAAGPGGVAVWDPERDEMPSPFLVRQRRIARV